MRRNSAAAEFSFSGASGSWTAPARISGRTVRAVLPLDEARLMQVLALLDGGRVSARGDDRPLPSLNVPDAGVAGRDWFACPRARLLKAGGPSPVTQAVPRSGP